ncbi:MAG: hypothetical protein Q9M27_02780 [Mariprofundaceae bacterium]|nr:hypothetical protein [Mariprofundaceae bacterium]
MKRAVAMLLVFVLVSISSIPLLPPGSGNDGGVIETPYLACHMQMASIDHAKHVLTPAMRHCRIECCGHHDIDGLPHLLAPHTVSLAAFDATLVVTDVADVNLPVLKPRLLPVPTPPPRFS